MLNSTTDCTISTANRDEHTDVAIVLEYAYLRNSGFEHLSGVCSNEEQMSFRES